MLQLNSPQFIKQQKNTAQNCNQQDKSRLTNLSIKDEGWGIENNEVQLQPQSKLPDKLQAL
ncbi:unnamed protein product [Paramecium sonneborni]|uniref:Uncharacterized protein n=1 Tax=Paramecium sonneborni TaxID=65129 RepID=A0A8S1RSC5_9CILI|nr:unnamed protein product [Paramecium sonneborni]